MTAGTPERQHRNDPWIFLRGLTRETRHWGDFPTIFRDKIPDAHIIAINLPGNGELHCMASPSRIEAMSEFCRQTLQVRGISPPYRLLALSLGAMVAVDWVTRRPEEIRSLVLINTSLRPYSPFYHRLRPRNYWNLINVILRANNAEAAERIVLRMTSRQGDSQTDILNAWIAYRRESPVSRLNTLRQLLAAARYCAVAQKPSPPTLLLASDADGLVNVKCSRELARRWGAAVAVHASAGHDLPLDDGRWVAERVSNWLERIST